MENRELAARYAKALLRADVSGSVDQEARALLDCFHHSHHLLVLFQDIMVPNQSKLTAIKRAFHEHLSETFLNFLTLVSNKRRMDHLPIILKEFLELRDQTRGTVKGVLRMATPLSADEIQSLEVTISRKFDRPCTLEPILDERLLGGFTVRVEDTLYDSSVRTQLDTLRTRFLNLVG
jgi:F-type H+-transporting ATPase subunit delta